MDERTRLPTNGLDGAGVLAQYVADWLACYGPLADAVGTMRIDGSEPVALCAVLQTASVVRLMASWELWQDWTGDEPIVADRRLAAYLGVETVAWLRFALWG